LQLVSGLTSVWPGLRSWGCCSVWRTTERVVAAVRLDMKGTAYAKDAND